MFAVLRQTNELSSILAPNVNKLERGLPIFDFSAQALLCGEYSQFNFFEPRYRLLATEAISKQGNFLLRGVVPSALDDGYVSACILVKIIDHGKGMVDGQIAVRCIAGPRIEVVLEEEQEVEGGKPLTRATEYTLMRDVSTIIPQEGEESVEEMRERCLVLLTSVRPVEDLTTAGLPPLDAEAFSYWAIRLVLAPLDAESRLNWLANRSTSDRIGHVIRQVEAYKERMKERAGAEEEEKEVKKS